MQIIKQLLSILSVGLMAVWPHVAGAAFIVLPPDSVVPPGTTVLPTGVTTTTVSTAEIDSVQNTSTTQQIQNYSIQLIARLQGGPSLFDQTFSVPATDPLFLAAIASAQSTLAAAGAVSFIGPTQLSSAVAQVNSVTTTTETDRVRTQLLFDAQAAFGPGTLAVGDLGVCQSWDGTDVHSVTGCTLPGLAYALAGGQRNVDSMYLSLISISTLSTTTNTYLTTQVWELVGILAGPPGVLSEPPTPALLGAAFFAVALLGRKRRPSTS